MKAEAEQRCRVCGGVFPPAGPASIYAEAGEWLSEELWRDAGQLCPQCLENRAKLAMMYVVDR